MHILLVSVDLLWPHSLPQCGNAVLIVACFCLRVFRGKKILISALLWLQSLLSNYVEPVIENIHVLNIAVGLKHVPVEPRLFLVLLEEFKALKKLIICSCDCLLIRMVNLVLLLSTLISPDNLLLLLNNNTLPHVNGLFQGAISSIFKLGHCCSKSYSIFLLFSLGEILYLISLSFSLSLSLSFSIICNSKTAFICFSLCWKSSKTSLEGMWLSLSPS